MRIVKTISIFALFAMSVFAWRTGDDSDVYANAMKTALWEANYAVSMGTVTNYNFLIATGTKQVFLDATFNNGVGAGTNLFISIRRGACWTNSGGTNTTSPPGYTNGSTSNAQVTGVADLHNVRISYNGTPAATVILAGEVSVPTSVLWNKLSNSGQTMSAFYITGEQSKEVKLPSPVLLDANSWYFLRVSNVSLGSYVGSVSIQIYDPTKK